VINEGFIFEEVDGARNALAMSYSSLSLRYVYRYEMQFLLELCGFKVDALHGNFQRDPFGYGMNRFG